LYLGAVAVIAWWIFFSVRSPFTYFQLAAVGRTTDQATLGRVATSLGNDPDVRSAAIAKLTDQSSLLEVATNDTVGRVAEAAAERLTDQTYLARVATTNTDAEVRRCAVGKLTDQVSLAQVAMNDRDAQTRLEVTKRLTNQAVLAQLATGDGGLYVHWAAVERLNDQSALVRVATTDKEFVVRRAAVERFTPEGLAAAADAAKDTQQRATLLAAALFYTAAHACAPRDGPGALLANLIPLALRYAKPESVAKRGALTRVKIDVRPVVQYYSRGSPIRGEVISLHLDFSLAGPVDPIVWSSRFNSEERLETDWSEAYIQLDDAP
jgi:hypothetical protein